MKECKKEESDNNEKLFHNIRILFKLILYGGIIISVIIGITMGITKIGSKNPTKTKMLKLIKIKNNDPFSLKIEDELNIKNEQINKLKQTNKKLNDAIEKLIEIGNIEAN